MTKTLSPIPASEAPEGLTPVKPGRSDVHRPSVLEPADYVEIAAYYIGSDEDARWAYASETRESQRAIDRYGLIPGGNFDRKGTCDHCGARFAYGVTYRHIPSGRVAVVGHICADNTLSLSSRVEKLRKEAAERGRIGRLVEEFVSKGDHADLIAWARQQTWSSFLTDLVAKLEKYGELSGRQVDAIRSSKRKAEARDAERAAAEAARGPRVPVVEGKAVVIEGKVVSTKWVDDPFRPAYHYTPQTLKWVVEDDRGFRVWGTVPEAVQYDGDNTIAAGARVRFTADIEKSQKDEYFGFAKRPRKAEFINA